MGHGWDMSGTRMGHVRQKWDNVRHEWEKWDMSGTQVGHEWDTGGTRMGHEWDTSDKSGTMSNTSGTSGTWVGYRWDK